MSSTSRHFTFGQDHMSSFALPCAGRLADFWVTVNLPEHMAGQHRDVFIKEFTSHYCPRPMQFASEYNDVTLRPQFFPGGQLCLITENGIQ